MAECNDCGTGSGGALLLDVDGETLCTSCADGHCIRCGTETEETTISGEFKCGSCQDLARGRRRSRDAGQGALDDFA